MNSTRVDINIILPQWNGMTSSPPKFKFFQAPRTGYSFMNVLSEEHSNEANRNRLFTEMTILSKFMDERRNKYRNDKGFRSIHKVDRLIHRYHQLDLNTATLAMVMNSTENTVPSKQLCEWYLTKLQTSVMILQRLSEYCRFSASKLQHRLRTGHNWIEITLALSMISRIWVLGKYLQDRAYSCYNNLVSFISKLRPNTRELGWLPECFELPFNLRTWVNRECKTLDKAYNAEGSAFNDKKKSLKQIKNVRQVRKILLSMNSYSEYKRFLNREFANHLTSNNREKCITKNMDELQFQKLIKLSKVWLKKLRENEGNVVRVKKLQKIMLKWLT